jgi:hypothetical protein
METQIKLTNNREPRYAYLCNGWPRGKQNPGNWIDESSNYVWNIAGNVWKGEQGACNPLQRNPNQAQNAPMAKVAAGGMFRLRYGGNGHTRGQNVGGDPGTVSIYWKGKPGVEIQTVSEFNKDNLLAAQGFSANSFSYPADPNIKSPTQGLVDKGNWMEVTLPKDTPAGRHMFVWVWSYGGNNMWSTCFDVEVTGNAGKRHIHSHMSRAHARSFHDHDETIERAEE